jgi:TonB family protein
LAVAVVAPLAAQAQSSGGTSGIEYFVPAKLVQRGTSTSGTAGAGTVVVQVLVNKDGTFKVQRVIRSSNHGDDAAALEIAKTSKYRPATRGTTPQTSFYDFTLNFTGSGQASAGSPEGTATGATGVDQYVRMMSAGNYSGAQTGLKTYVAAHPDDAKAELELGVASAALGQPLDATAAFDKAGTIPPDMTAVAGKAYNDAAAADIKAKDDAAAVAAAKRAVELAPGFFTYNTLGFAELNSGANDAAIADLEKARSLGATDKSVKAQERAKVDGNLISAYLNAGKPDSAKAIAAEAKQLDPSETGSATALAAYDYKTAQADATAGKQTEAAALYEQAAELIPSQAANLYGAAAFALLNVKPTVDYAKVKAEADKGLAADPDDAMSNFAAGIVLGNTPGKTADALVYLNKADASAKKANNTSLASAIENTIKQLGGNK